MTSVPSLIRQYSLLLLVALFVSLGAAAGSWFFAVEAHIATLRENRFLFVLNNIRGALELGLRLGLPLHELPGIESRIRRDREHEILILSVDVFDESGHIVFTTDASGTSSDVQSTWRTECLSEHEASWRGSDEQGRLLCRAVRNGYDQVVGGVLLRYQPSERSRTFSLLSEYQKAVAALLLLLTSLGALGGWLALRPVEKTLRQHMSAIAGIKAANSDSLAEPLATALASITWLECELDAVDAEAARLDNLE